MCIAAIRYYPLRKITIGSSQDIIFAGSEFSTTNPTTINGLYSSTGLFDVPASASASLTLANLTLRGFTVDDNGAVIESLGGASISLVRVFAHSNRVGSSYSGGVVYVLGGTTSIIDSTFSGNSAGNGGALYVYSTSSYSITLNVRNSIFFDNTA